MIDSAGTRVRPSLPPSPREVLIERHLPLAKRLARRHQRTPGDLEDLEQVAALSLVKAADRFDPGRGVAFNTFATATIVGAIKNHFRDRCWAVHVPRGLRERAMHVEAEAWRLTARLGRAPSVTEIGDSLGLPAEDVAGARAAITGRDAASLDAPLEQLSEEGHVRTRGDALATIEEGYETIEARTVVDAALPKLSKQYRLALELRFGAGMTQRQIGRRLGVSQMQVSRILSRSLDTLRAVVEI